MAKIVNPNGIPGPENLPPSNGLAYEKYIAPNAVKAPNAHTCKGLRSMQQPKCQKWCNENPDECLQNSIHDIMMTVCRTGETECECKKRLQNEMQMGEDLLQVAPGVDVDKLHQAFSRHVAFACEK